jgi:carboxypeptidase Taq
MATALPAMIAEGDTQLRTKHDRDSMHSSYDRLCEHVRETELLASINNLLAWDERTMLPAGGAEFRARQMATLAGIIHQRRVDPRVGRWLGEIEACQVATDPASDAAVTICRLRRDYDRNVKLPRSLIEALTRAAVVGQQVWELARQQNDFRRFAPYLDEIVSLVREKADALAHDGNRYDALLDEYEPGVTTAEFTSMLHPLRNELLRLMDRILACGHKPDTGFLRREYPVATQRRLCRFVAHRIGFDFKRGRIDATAHPFCESIGPADCRITTRYRGHAVPDALFGTLHEAGHGVYEQGLRQEAYGLPLGQAASLGIHESQSRLWENIVGRSVEFWEYFFRHLQHAFPAALRDVTCEQFCWAVNAVEPSLIRVEADEVTYNLHILVRFELEQELVSGRLAVSDLPDAWNAKYDEFLGIRPPDDAQGVLQDIHWASATLGYFPTYALGNVYAAQLFAKIMEDMPDWRGLLRRGQFDPLRNWLRDHVHLAGRRFTSAELIEKVTGRRPCSSFLMSYLTNKMTHLYRLA